VRERENMKDKIDTSDEYEHPAEQCEDCIHERYPVCMSRDGLCEKLNPNNDCELFHLWKGPKTVRRDET